MKLIDSHGLEGAQISSLSPAECEVVLSSFFGEDVDTTFPEFEQVLNAFRRARWGIVQCTDTFVWGIRKGEKWRWGWQTEAGGENEPAVRAASMRMLLEARLFSPEEDILIWRDGAFGDTRFRGRILSGEAAIKDELYFTGRVPRTPEQARKEWKRQDKIVRLDDDFCWRMEPGGNITVTPHGEGVVVQHYLAQHRQTGAVRIAGTRFVDIINAENPQDNKSGAS